MWGPGADSYDEFKAEVRRETPCRYYFRPDNTCKFGDACSFSHNPSNVKNCRFYKSPNYTCKYADKCLFRHDRPHQPDTREKYDVKLYKERQQFKFEELRKLYLQQKEETKVKFSIMPFTHGIIPKEWLELSWDEAMNTLINLKETTAAEIQTIPGYTELFKKNLSSLKRSHPAQLQVCIFDKDKASVLEPRPKITKSIMVANWKTGEITVAKQRDEGIETDADPNGEKMETQPVDATGLSEDNLNGCYCHFQEKSSDKSTKDGDNICPLTEQATETSSRVDNKELEENDQAIATILTEEETEKKALVSLLEFCQDEKKIQADEKEQEKSDLMIAVLITEDEKQKKEEQLDQDDTEESKIGDDEKEKENDKESIRETPSATTTASSTPDTPNPDTPSSIATPKAQIPPNTPTTVEVQKSKTRRVSISMKEECIPSRLEKMCSIIKSFYDQLCEFLTDRSIVTWDPKQVFIVYTEALTLGLEDFHKYEQSVLLNCIFDHWMPSVTKWAEFLTLLTEEYAKDVVDPDQKHEESLQALITELMWWINEKEENPIFVGASFAGLLKLGYCFEDIDFMMDTIVCEIDLKGDVTGGILVGMSKYMKLENFAYYVHHYLAAMGCVDFSMCSCKTFKCICPVEVPWEDGVSALEPICEYSGFDKEQEAKFFSIATDTLWDKVMLLMIAEEVFPLKSSHDIFALLDQTNPFPRSDSELGDLYDSIDDTYQGSSVESTDGSNSGEYDSDFDEGLVEYDLEEMEKGNLSTPAVADARFQDPVEGDLQDPNNNSPAEPDRHLGAAIDMAMRATTARKKTDQTRRDSNKSDDHGKYSPKKRYRRKSHPTTNDGETANRRPSKSPIKPKYRSPQSHKDTEKWVRSHSIGNEGKTVNTARNKGSHYEDGHRDHEEAHHRKSPTQKSPSHRRNSGKTSSQRKKSADIDNIVDTDTAPPAAAKPVHVDQQSSAKEDDAKSPKPKEQRPPRRRRRSAALKQDGNEETKEKDYHGSDQVPTNTANGENETETAAKTSLEAKGGPKSEEDSPTFKSPARKRRRSNRRRSNPDNNLDKSELEEKSEQRGNERKGSEDPQIEGKKEKPKSDNRPREQPSKDTHPMAQQQKDHPVGKEKVIKEGVKSPRRRGSRNSGRMAEKKENGEDNVTKDNKPESNNLEKQQKPNRRGSNPDKKPAEESKPCKTWKGLCRNKGKSTCVQAMCANCCIQTDEDCKVHELAKSQRMTRNLIPACVTGGYGPRAKRVDFNRITPFRYFTKRAEFEKFMNTTCEEIIHRVCFGPNFGIRDEHVIKVCEKFGQSLLVLDLGCSDSGDGVRLTDEAAFAIAKYCPKMIKVKLESCTNISDDAALALMESCLDLQYVEISGHDKQKGKLTASVLEPLFNKKHHPSLKTLCLNDQELGEHGIIRRLGRCRPSIKIYNEDTYDYDRYIYWGGNSRY